MELASFFGRRGGGSSLFRGVVTLGEQKLVQLNSVLQFCSQLLNVSISEIKLIINKYYSIRTPFLAKTELSISSRALSRTSLLHALLCYVRGMINFINRVPRSSLKSTLGVNRLAFEISPLLVQQVAGILIIQGKLEIQSPGSH